MVSAAMFLGWLFTYLIHSTVLIVGVWALTRVLPRMSLDTKENLWRLALFGGLLTSAVQVGFGLTPLPGNVEVPDAMVARAEKGSSAVVSPVGSSEGLVEHNITEHQAGELTITTVRHAAELPVFAAPMHASSWPWLIMGLVLAGSVLALGRLAWAARRLHRKLQGRRDVIEDPLLETHLALCAKAEFKNRPRLTASSNICSPLASWRNEICLPERAVDSLSPQQQQGMLAHELAHLLRRDPAWRLGTAVFEAVLFFQPLNHLARRKLGEISEFQCDDWAARNTGGGVHLAKCLAEVATWLDGRPQDNPIVPAMASPGSPIVRRITRLLGRPDARPAGHAVTRVAVTVFVLGAMTWLVPGVGYARPMSSRERGAAAEHRAFGVRFVDTSTDGYDRSTVHIDSGGEHVEVRVRARRPSLPPPQLESIPLDVAPQRERRRIIVRGGYWGGLFGSSSCWMGAACGSSLLFEFEFDVLDALQRAGAMFGVDPRRDRERRRMVPRPRRAPRTTPESAQFELLRARGGQPGDGPPESLLSL